MRQFEGKRFNSPNDLVVKGDGSIWFTDPSYGILSNYEAYTSPSKLGDNDVFCYQPDSGDLRLVSSFIAELNGLAFSPDESLLYVSDTSAALHQTGGGNHHIVVFDVRQNSLLNPWIFAVVSPGLPDGFRIDTQGWMYTSIANRVQVYHPDGSLLGKIRVPEKAGNLTCGGHRRNTLYIAASTSLYRIKLQTQGLQRP